MLSLPSTDLPNPSGEPDNADAVRALLTLRGADDRGLVTEGAAWRPWCGCGPDGQAWRGVADEAEYHGVAPLIAPMISRLCADRPDLVDVGRVFATLTSRHRRASVVREACIDELLQACAHADAPIILLKGAALAHILYPSPAVRPMVDIDVLVAADAVPRVVEICRKLGFSFASTYHSRFAARMHHLPPATAERAGFRVALEIHTDAMSPDQADRLTFASLTEPPQRFRRGTGPDGLALGHTDMLRHLSRHVFEPARRIRLIHLYDLWRYHRMLEDRVDCRLVAARFPHVAIASRLIAQVFSDPEPAVSRQASEAIPTGAGRGMVPLSEIAAMTEGPRGKLNALFNPPAWWMHGFYAVPPERSLLFCRMIRHPARVAQWLLRRWLGRVGVVARVGS
jgi:hypothetical protein